MKNIGWFFIFILIWGFFCPKGHLVYYLKQPHKSGDMVKSSDFYTCNFGYFVNGVYSPMTWSAPKSGELASCPIDHEPLIFETKYEKKL